MSFEDEQILHPSSDLGTLWRICIYLYSIIMSFGLPGVDEISWFTYTTWPGWLASFDLVHPSRSSFLTLIPTLKMNAVHAGIGISIVPVLFSNTWKRTFAFSVLMLTPLSLISFARFTITSLKTYYSLVYSLSVELKAITVWSWHFQGWDEYWYCILLESQIM